MHLKTIKIQNFRSLEDIYVDFKTRVNVIVGPNAAGKTTILEAVRLLKAMLAPRVQNEAIQVLQSLGAASPHMPNRLRLNSIARDETKPIVIGCRFWLGDKEISDLSAGIGTISTAIVQSQVGQAFAAPDALIGFMSSPQGKAMLTEATTLAQQTLEKVKSRNDCYLELTLAPNVGPSSTGDATESQFIAFLERRLPPYKTSFTYFPADRALPAGEQAVQLGGPDAAQQLESYNAQPQIKFNRLKNTIFSAAVIGESLHPEESLAVQFENIFNGILKGRRLVEFGVNEIGLLTVRIQETETGRVFDLDGMSSGEKGLILTFLLIARSVVVDGMVLLDEPELHLNPAVCKDLLTYLIDQYVKPRNLQVLVCSHSPEILAGAFDNEDCSLYHLISGTTLTKVRPQDEMTLGNALRRLGAQESENLLYRGIIFVEGPDDIALLEAGFANLLRRYKLKFSTGRNEVEKAIRALQIAEKDGIKSEPTYFIFDRDDSPTSLSSSDSAKVLQWDRRCLENYLLDIDAITNLLMDADVVKTPYTNQGDVSRLLREIAFQQLDETAARRTYAKYNFQGLGLRREDLSNKKISDIASAALQRIVDVKKQLESIDVSQWDMQFQAAVEKERHELEAIWDTKWVIDCDGKRLLEDLAKRVSFKMNLKKLKIRLIKEIALNQSPSWMQVEGYLKSLLYTPSK